MANTKISALTAATVPLAGTETLPVVQGGATKKIAAAALTGMGYVAVPASAIDLATGGFFSKTISGTTTFTISNPPASGVGFVFLLELTNGGSATVNWFSGVKWPGGVAPSLTASGVDVLAFYTRDGGTTWRCTGGAKDVR